MGLPKTKAAHIVGGYLQTAPKAHLHSLQHLWAALPDAPERIPVTPEMVALLQSEYERTGIGPSALLRGTSSERPSGLSSTQIYYWLRGTAKTAKRRYLDYVLDLWASLPDQSEKMPVTTELRVAMQAEIKRTGISLPKLIKMARKPPNDLNWDTVQRAIYGEAKTLDRRHFDWLMQQWRQCPDAPERITITAEIRAAMKAEIKRTNIGVARLMRMAKTPPPADYKPAKSQPALYGNAGSMQRNHYEWLMQEWQQLPDAEE